MSLLVCSLNPLKQLTLMSWNFEEWFPSSADGFWLKNFQIWPTICLKMHDASNNPPYLLIHIISNLPPALITILPCIQIDWLYAKILLMTKIGNVEWNGAWFMKYWVAFIRPFSTENWATWLRQFLPHFLPLTRKFLTLYITSSFLWKYFLQKNVIYKKVEMLYIVNVFKSSLKLLAIWIWICEIKRVIKWAFYFSNWNY